jgi:thymidylate synthase (FAD)
MALLMKKAIEEQYPELSEYLVPKCEKYKDMPFCTEHKSCGRHPLLKDIYDRYNDFNTIMNEAFKQKEQ